jgi:hypothetical protein
MLHMSFLVIAKGLALLSPQEICPIHICTAAEMLFLDIAFRDRIQMNLVGITKLVANVQVCKPIPWFSARHALWCIKGHL